VQQRAAFELSENRQGRTCLTDNARHEAQRECHGFLEGGFLWKGGFDFRISSVEVDLGSYAPAPRRNVGGWRSGLAKGHSWQGWLGVLGKRRLKLALVCNFRSDWLKVLSCN
jgi:hypothetical protein